MCLASRLARTPLAVINGLEWHCRRLKIPSGDRRELLRALFNQNQLYVVARKPNFARVSVADATTAAAATTTAARLPPLSPRRVACSEQRDGEVVVEAVVEVMVLANVNTGRKCSASTRAGEDIGTDASKAQW